MQKRSGFRWRSLLFTLAGWGCVGLITSAYGSAFMWLIVAPLYVLWLIIQLCRLAMPTVRDRVSLRFWWVGPAVFLVLLPLYVHRYQAARNMGDGVAQRIEQYRQQLGMYPADEETLGLDRQMMHDARLVFIAKDGQPFLYYASPLTIFDGYSYDFDHHRWNYLAD